MTRRVLAEEDVKKLIECKKVAAERNCYIFDDGKHFKVYRKGAVVNTFIAKVDTLGKLTKLVKKI